MLVIFKSISFFYLTLILFVTSCMTPSLEDQKAWGEYSKFVYIKISNKSGKEVNTVMFFPYELNPRKLGLKNERDTNLTLECHGESSYKLIAILSNGDTLKTKGNYYEGGYSLKEIITNDSIITKY